MGEIRDYIKKLNSVTVEEQESALLGILHTHEAYIVDLNLSQMKDGIDSTGTAIAPPYSPFTIMMKKVIGQPYDRVTLFNEGDFYRGGFLDITNFPAKIDSKDEKSTELKYKYGEDIFGETESNQSLVNKEIKPDVQGYYTKLLSVR